MNLVKVVNNEHSETSKYSQTCLFSRKLQGILLDWEHPASEERVFEAEKYEWRHPDSISELFVTKKLVVEGVQVEDSGSYICKVTVLLGKKIKAKILSDFHMQARSNQCPGRMRESKQMRIKVETEEHLSVVFK